MWPMAVVVRGVGGQDCSQVPFADYKHPVGAFPAGGADPAFGEGVGARGLRRCLDDLDARGGEYGVEDGGELGVPVAQREPRLVCSLVEVDQQVPGLLGDPDAGGVSGHADDVGPAGRQFYEEQYVDPFEEHRVDGEGVARQDAVGLGGQEPLPGRSRSSRCRVDAGLVQDLPPVLAATW
jgi:hypothetical protein